MRVVAVYSIKGGVGKTTTAVNLAWQAAQEAAEEAALTLPLDAQGAGGSPAPPEAGRRVLLWDLDPQGAATYLLGVKPKLKGGAGALVRGKRSVADDVRPSAVEGLDVLPADFSYRDLELDLDAAKKSRRRLDKALGAVAGRYRYALLDCPPGASLVAENILVAADVVVVPLVPGALALRSLAQVEAMVAGVKRPPRVFGFLSMVDRHKSAHRRAAAELPARHADVLDVVVPYNAAVEAMGARRAPLATYAKSSEPARAYARLWRQVAAALR